MTPPVHPPALHAKAEPDEVRAALGLLDELPFPALWVRHDRQVHWANRAARAGGRDLAAPCHLLCHGYAEPCALHGQACPMESAERTGRPASVLHAAPDAPADLLRIHAIPLSVGGVLEFHIPLHDALNRDPVTGWLTRRAFGQAAAAALERYARADTAASILVVALAGLERICAQHGHEAVDTLRARTAQLVGRYLAADPVAGHWLAEEFVVLQPCADQTQARGVLHDLHAAVGTLRTEMAGLDRRAGVHAGLWCGSPAFGFNRALAAALQDCFSDLRRRSALPP